MGNTEIVEDDIQVDLMKKAQLVDQNNIIANLKPSTELPDTKLIESYIIVFKDPDGLSYIQGIYEFVPAGHQALDHDSYQWQTRDGKPTGDLDGRPFWWVSEDDILRGFDT